MPRLLAVTAVAPLSLLVLALTYDGRVAVDLVHLGATCLALSDLALVGLGLRFDRETPGWITGALNTLSGLGAALLAVPATVGTAVWYTLFTIVAAAEWDSFDGHAEREYMGLRAVLWATVGVLSLGRAAAWTWATYRRATTTMSPDPS